ncbi:MAG: DMT family transporter [Alphaproteobacteria bacterium]|nr:MAG: DMT family transporter [Alphaproteobacteria bacterium]
MTSRKHHDDSRKNTLIAIGLTCIAYGYFNIGDAALKMLAGKFHFSQIIVTNCLIIIACMVTSGWIREGRKAFVMHNPKGILLRACLSCAVGILNILAIPHIQLTTFYTLVFTSPFWVALLATVFLKEKLDPHRAAVIMAGFATIAFVFHPGSALFNIWAVLILIGAFFYSCSLIVMRRLGPKESRTMIITMGSLVSTIVALPFLPFHFIWPTPYEWGLFVLMGTLGSISVTCIAYAYQNAPSAAVVAPYHYTQMIWGTLLGYYLFNEIPDDRIVLGAALIIAAGLYLLVTEARRKPKIVEVPESAAVS